MPVSASDDHGSTEQDQTVSRTSSAMHGEELRSPISHASEVDPAEDRPGYRIPSTFAPEEDLCLPSYSCPEHVTALDAAMLGARANPLGGQV